MTSYTVRINTGQIQGIRIETPARDADFLFTDSNPPAMCMVERIITTKKRPFSYVPSKGVMTSTRAVETIEPVQRTVSLTLPWYLHSKEARLMQVPAENIQYGPTPIPTNPTSIPVVRDDNIRMEKAEKSKTFDLFVPLTTR